MKALVTSFVFLISFGAATSQANEVDLTAHSCRAKPIDRFYCPVSGDWWQGPYYDRGCSVKCEEEQRAVCKQAGCDNSGDAVASSCSCE